MRDPKIEPTLKPVDNSKPTIHNVHILDASSSMLDNSKYLSAISGIEEEMKMLKENKDVNFTQTIVEFKTETDLNNVSFAHQFIHKIKIIKHCVGKALHEVVNIKWDKPSGLTPLYQAVGEVIEDILRIKADKDAVLVKIFTDGAHNINHGKYSNVSDLKQLMDKVQKDNNFTITFVGTDFDVEKIIQSTGVSRGNTMSHDNTQLGVKMSFASLSNNTALYSKSIARGASGTTMDFFAQEEENSKQKLKPIKTS